VELLTAAGHVLPSRKDALFAKAERATFDLQMRMLRDVHPRPLAEDVVLVGVDEATEAIYVEPIALWHRHFADALHALAKARPRAVGVDFVLPERSYDGIVKGLDSAMMRAIVGIKHTAPLCTCRLTDNRGGPLAGPAQYTPTSSGPRTSAPTSTARSGFGLAPLQRARPVDGRAVADVRGTDPACDRAPVSEGYIDYSLGAPIDYVPMHKLAMPRAIPRSCRRCSAGRIVLIGSVLRRTTAGSFPRR
jgi:hypothetical protein